MAESISNNSSSSASYDVHSISLYSDKGAQQAVREITDNLAKKGIKRDQELLLHKDQKKEGILKYLLKRVTVAKSLFERLLKYLLKPVTKYFTSNKPKHGVGNTNTYMFIPFKGVMQLFGYAVRKGGIYYSIAGAVGRSCIRKGVPEFIKRMELIYAINEAAHKKGYIPRTEETDEERKEREAIKDKVIGELLPNGGIYSEDAHQLLNFFDEMSVSDNYISEEWQKALGRSGRQDLEEARWESDGDALESRELYLKESFTAHHNFFASNKLQNFLQKLRDDNGDKPWHVMIHFPEHTCSIGFDGLKFLVSEHNCQIYTDNLSGAMHLINDNSDFSVKWECLQIFGAKEDDLSIDEAKKVLSDVRSTEKEVLKDELMFIPFMKVMQLFGYAVRAGEGICFSIAGAAGRSCIRKGVPEFIKRMELIRAINQAAHKKGYIPRTEETDEERKEREAIKDKVIKELLPNGGIYSEDGHQLLNFFDEMSVSDTYISEEWKEALDHSDTQDLEEARWESDGDALESRELYLKECFITYDNFFTNNKLQNFLQKLRNDNGDKPWHVMIHFPEHTCSIGFDGLKFLVSDHNHQIYTDNLSGAMHLIHNDSDFSVKLECLEIFGAKEDDLSIGEQAKKVLSDVQITEKKVSKDELPVAARLGATDTETVKSLLKKILSGKQKNSVDQAELVKEYSDCINACMEKTYVYNKPQIMQVYIQTIVTEIDNNEFLSDTEKKELLRKFLFGNNEFPVLCCASQSNRFKVTKVYIHTVMSAIENTSLPSEHKRELQIDLLGKRKDEKKNQVIQSIMFSKSFKGMNIYVEAIWAAVQDLQWSCDEKKALLTELLLNTEFKFYSHMIPRTKENQESKFVQLQKSYILVMIQAIQNLTMPAEEKKTLYLELLTAKGQDPWELSIYDSILRLNDEEINKLFFSVISADQLDELVSEKWSIDYLREAHKKATEQQ